jgi:excisionase family DNA binding protein
MQNSPNNSLGLLVKVPVAAEMLAIGRSTVYELIAAGSLDIVHIGRSIRITTRSIEDFVERSRSGASDS